MKDKSSIMHKQKMVVRCPECNHIVLDIQSGSKPFKPSATDVVLNTKCSRCGNAVKVLLCNA